jgi:hypothetical protein
VLKFSAASSGCSCISRAVILAASSIHLTMLMNMPQANDYEIARYTTQLNYCGPDVELGWDGIEESALNSQMSKFTIHAREDWPARSNPHISMLIDLLK